VLVIKVAGGLVLVVLILAFSLRGRVGAARAKSDGERRPKSKHETRPTLPPSPYQPSRGFHIVNSDEPELPHQVQLPRLDPNKEFVFNDSLAAPTEHASAPHLRHDEQWALDRSMRHAPHPRVRRRRRLTWALLVLVLAAGLVAVLLFGHSPVHPAGLGVF
jgi:hypothetical protein